MTNIELPDDVQAWLLAAGAYDTYEIVEVFIGTEAGADARAAALTKERTQLATRPGSRFAYYFSDDLKVDVEHVHTFVEGVGFVAADVDEI